MKNKDIDVFLGNWMPSQDADRKPYIEDKSIVETNMNLKGAKYTLAVPKYLWDAGLKTSRTSPSSRISSKARSSESSRATTATVWSWT